MLRLLDDHLDEDGSKVDYRSMRYSAAFAAFCDSAGELGELPAEALDGRAPLAERTAFWINLYNCLVLHATAVLGAPADAEERNAFFSGTSGAAYTVAGTAQRLALLPSLLPFFSGTSGAAYTVAGTAQR